jgi:hypothetical protein
VTSDAVRLREMASAHCRFCAGIRNENLKVLHDNTARSTSPLDAKHTRKQTTYFVPHASFRSREIHVWVDSLPLTSPRAEHHTGRSTLKGQAITWHGITGDRGHCGIKSQRRLSVVGESVQSDKGKKNSSEGFLEAGKSHLAPPKALSCSI